MHYLLAIFFGGLASLAFEPYGFWYCALFGIAGWYWVLTQHRLKQRVFISYLFGLSILLPTQHWTGIYVGNLPWLVLCFAQALIFILPALLMRRNHRANQFIFPLSYVTIELLLRTVPFTGFGWSRLSLTQTDSPYDSVYRQIGLAGMALVIATIVIVRNIKHILILAVILASVYFIPDNVINDGEEIVAAIVGAPCQSYDLLILVTSLYQYSMTYLDDKCLEFLKMSTEGANGKYLIDVLPSFKDVYNTDAMFHMVYNNIIMNEGDKLYERVAPYKPFKHIEPADFLPFVHGALLAGGGRRRTFRRFRSTRRHRGARRSTRRDNRHRKH